jgi:hypothetical protein
VQIRFESLWVAFWISHSHKSHSNKCFTSSSLTTSKFKPHNWCPTVNIHQLEKIYIHPNALQCKKAIYCLVTILWNSSELQPHKVQGVSQIKVSDDMATLPFTTFGDTSRSKPKEKNLSCWIQPTTSSQTVQFETPSHLVVLWTPLHQDWLKCVTKWADVIYPIMSSVQATVNQHPPVHHEGWMISGKETVFCWLPVP